MARINATMLQLEWRATPLSGQPHHCEIEEVSCSKPGGVEHRKENRVDTISFHELLKQHHCGCFVQRLVVVAALGRLYAGWASVVAWAFLHGSQRSLP